MMMRAFRGAEDALFVVQHRDPRFINGDPDYQGDVVASPCLISRQHFTH
jgi:hypothetical protein